MSTLAPSISRSRRPTRWTPRTALLQVAVTVALLPWLVQPGVIQPDTKVDLVVSPGRYLSRAFDAWSTHSGFGELQNQAYGYLFPMGPVFWLGDVVGLPAWAIQRMWWSILLLVAATGAMAVARRVVGLSPLAAGVAGVLFALSPRVLTLLSELSVEAWPGALLPWFVLAVHGYCRGHLAGWRFAALVGVLSACCGGVNATASLVPVVGAWLFLLLCGPRGSRVRGTAWFALGALAGAAWWLGPLVVLGRYAYPFMDYIETSRITTAVTSVPGILRGASDWVAYIIDVDGHPVWQSGWIVAQATTSIIGGLALAGLGLAGLAPWGSARDVRREGRAFAVMLGAGVLLMGVAYVGAVSGPWAWDVRSLLDGPLAAARNVHKADPLVRLPLVLGVGALLDRARSRRVLAGLGVALAAAGSLAPFWQGRLGDVAGVTRYPSSVAQAASAIDADARTRGGSTFVLPSARSAAFAWGTSTDEPLTAFAASPIAWRASAPLVHPGAQRLMDAVDANLTTGHDLDAAAQALSRAGVRRVVVRSGLTSAEQAPPATSVVAHLIRAPKSFTHHRTFGSGTSRYDLFDVEGPGLLGTAPTLGVLGGPESTISLAAAGVTPGLAYRTGEATGWITDDVRKRAYDNGRSVALAFGPTLTTADTSDERLGARDLTYPGRSASLVTLRLDGLDHLDATASTADPFAATYLGPGTGPAAALDGDAGTAWLTSVGGRSAPGTLTLGWSRGTSRPTTLTLTPATTGGARLTGWTLDVDGRRSSVHSGPHPRIDLPRGTHTVRLTPKATAGDDTSTVGLTEITASGVPLRATPQLPGSVDAASNGVVLTPTKVSVMGHALRAEDGTRWSRAFTVRDGGTMDVRIVPDAGTSCADVRVTGADAAYVEPTSGGCTRRLTLRPGTARLTAAGGHPAHVVLVPHDVRAQHRLGLGGRPDGAPVTTLSTGANAGWAEPAGSTSLVVDGWQQAFTGRVDRAAVHFAPERLHRLALGLGALTAAVCLVGVLLPGRRGARVTPRRADRPPSPAAATSIDTPRAAWLRASREHLPCLLTLLIGIALAGWWGLAALALGLVTPRRRRALLAGVLLAAAGPVMATLGVVDKSSVGAFVGQLLGVTAVSTFVLAFDGGPTRWPGVRRSARTPRPPRR